MEDNIKMGLREMEWSMDCIDLVQDTELKGSCECDDELLNSIKCGKFLDYLRTWILPPSRLLRCVRWYETDVSWLPIDTIFEGPETSVSNHLTPPNNTGHRRIQFHRGRSVRPHTWRLVSFSGRTLLHVVRHLVSYRVYYGFEPSLRNNCDIQHNLNKHKKRE